MAKSKPNILVVDDGTTYAEAVQSRMPEFNLLDPGNGASPPCLKDGVEALEFLGKHSNSVDVVLLDMHFDSPSERLFPLGEGVSHRRTKRFQGVAILRKIRENFPELPVVLLTALEDLSLVDAAEELTSQSMTYILDGDDLDALRIRINAALQDAVLEEEDSLVLWGGDSGMRAVRRRLAVLARGRMPVIIEGETGTGKSFLAERFVHMNSGRSGPFVVLDLSALPRELVPAHLFGALKGAYTGAVADRKGVFELAHGGTLFIDEIQNVPLEVQKQLLLVLQDGRVRPLGSSREIAVDVKVIAASNKPLDEAVTAGRFRPDLYMRLSPATRVPIPPLRERPGDLDFLARRFVAKAADDQDISELAEEIAVAIGLPRNARLEFFIGRPTAGAPKTDTIELVIPKPAWKMIEKHRWPGNIRELEMAMHNLLVFTLVATVDALRSGLPISSPRLQVDPGLIGELLAGSAGLSETPIREARALDENEIAVRVEPGNTLNAVANSIERQYFLELFRRHNGDFGDMASALLNDRKKGRAVRLRFNQLGLRVREVFNK